MYGARFWEDEKPMKILTIAAFLICITPSADARTCTFETISETLRIPAIGGDARYTVHLTDGPMVVSYLGTCTQTDE
jgi:hypothetical protein